MANLVISSIPSQFISWLDLDLRLGLAQHINCFGMLDMTQFAMSHSLLCAVFIRVAPSPLGSPDKVAAWRLLCQLETDV